jgi:DNA replication and repair protein RecF
MFLRNITLQDYRNYSHLQLEFSPHINVIYGLNAQGKSNLIEAIAYLVAGKSFRGHHERDLVQEGKPYFLVEGQIESATSHQLKITWNPRDGKHYFVDGNGVRGIRRYMGYFHAVVFEPKDVLFFQEEPRIRREFVDDEYGTLSPSYYFVTQQYLKVLKERNEALKTVVDEVLDRVYRERLAQLGLEIRSKRQLFLKELGKHLSTYFTAIYGEELSVELQYLPQVPMNIHTVEDCFGYWETYTDQEHRIQQTQVGPHRDDFRVVLRGKDIATYGSQGQQRIAVVALKLALIRYIDDHSGTGSIVLLDDVLSELDVVRRSRLIQEVRNHHQVMLTLTSRDVLDNQLLKDARLIEVRQGLLDIKET